MTASIFWEVKQRWTELLQNQMCDYYWSDYSKLGAPAAAGNKIFHGQIEGSHEMRQTICILIVKVYDEGIKPI